MQTQDETLRMDRSFRPSVELATLSHDQLRSVAGMGGLAVLSFDQTAVEAVARMHSIQLSPRAAADLHFLQSEGLRLMRAET